MEEAEEGGREGGLQVLHCMICPIILHPAAVISLLTPGLNGNEFTLMGESLNTLMYMRVNEHVQCMRIRGQSRVRLQAKQKLDVSKF